MKITLSQAIAMLGRYVGYGNDATERINLVTQRLIQAGNWSATKDTVVFNLYPDSEERAFITLPYFYETVLACVFFRQDEANSLRCGIPANVQTAWFSFLPSGPGYSESSRFQWGQGIIPEVDKFTTFKNWHTPKKLRLKFATTQTNGLEFNIRGRFNDEIIYTGVGSNMIEGENLITAGAATLETVSEFQAPPYELFKPETHGPVKMYTWDGVVEELVAIYYPTETVPQMTRYRVPACTAWTEANPGFLLAVCKRSWTPIADDNDPVIPGNIGAIRFGLQALLKEDAEDYERAQQLWQMAFDLMAKEAEDEQGAGAVVRVQVEDAFMQNAGTLMGGNYWNNYGW